MIEKIKRWFFDKELNVQLKNNGAVRNGVNAAASIGILFDGTLEADRKTVHKFKKQLNPSGAKQIKSLAFIQNKLPLDNIDYNAYNEKDVKWYGVPFGEKVEEFIQYNFDILIIPQRIRSKGSPLTFKKILNIFFQRNISCVFCFRFW